MAKEKSKVKSKIAIKPHFLSIKERKTSLKEVNLGYKNLQEVISECERCYQCKDPPPCVTSCPTHCDSKAIIKNVLEGNFDNTIQIIYEHYVFPKSTERICPGFCQIKCTAGKKGDPIQIPLIKRYLVDNNKILAEFFKCGPETGKKVAIIGSGPLGLTSAYLLRRMGHEVTVFEKFEVLGGMLIVGIPEFRLPKRILNEEIENIKKIGVNFVKNKSYDENFDFNKIFNEGFNAILLGIGTHKPKWMNIPGEKAYGVIHAIELLRDFNLGKNIPSFSGKKVIVVGGGSSATDAARVAKRLGADVTIVYRRQKEQMPAGKGEVMETEEEGIIIQFLTNPNLIVCQENEVTGINCIKMKLGEKDSSGRPEPIPIEGSDFNIKADIMIEAISQEPDLTSFDKIKFKISRWNTFEVNENFSTSVSGIFAGGDCVTGSKTVIEAIAYGKKIAEAINKYLSSKKN